MSHDLINSAFYNEYFESLDKIPFGEAVTRLILNYVPPASRVLEIGSGAGALALWVANQGHQVSCIEPAEKPAEKARAKGLQVFQTRFQEFSVTQQFDAILAISSLIHIPRSEMPVQIQKMSSLLTQNGIAIVSFLDGNGESYEDPTEKGKKRFFSKFREDELQALLSPHFSIIEMDQVEVKKMGQSFFLMALRRKDGN